MNNYLELAKQHATHIGGQWAAIKYDGWQGNVRDGILTSSTGRVLAAPNWWQDKMPSCPLRGELFTTRGNRGQLQSIVNKKRPHDAEWQEVTFRVFDMPGAGDDVCFADVYEALRGFENDVVRRIEQVELPFEGEHEALAHLIAVEKARGGEGIVVRDPWAAFEDAWSMLKYKPKDDAEGVVVGVVAGAGQLLGRMGSLVLKIANGLTLAISGFQDVERGLTDPAWAREHPGKQCPAWIESASFPHGSTVTFQHRGVTEAGMPIHASYWRRFEFV